MEWHIFLESQSNYGPPQFCYTFHWRKHGDSFQNLPINYPLIEPHFRGDSTRHGKMCYSIPPRKGASKEVQNLLGICTPFCPAQFACCLRTFRLPSIQAYTCFCCYNIIFTQKLVPRKVKITLSLRKKPLSVQIGLCILPARFWTRNSDSIRLHVLVRSARVKKEVP